ncbi:hypothetical protein PGT21_016106 [Puccinia graminis f. sp. tritici]|uniref:Uncharacterized protein n=1 Tax=Puccinia graminis f. sp. tritici TaxID=56615 RepID=A0A5B0LPD0_PUCGR|nr:hypothetical protein PGT21_016106 [Puccinia graminis f. sp. tritici]
MLEGFPGESSFHLGFGFHPQSPCADSSRCATLNPVYHNLARLMPTWVQFAKNRDQGEKSNEVGWPIEKCVNEAVGDRMARKKTAVFNMLNLARSGGTVWKGGLKVGKLGKKRAGSVDLARQITSSKTTL